MGTVWPLYLFSFVFVVVLSNIVFSRKVWNLEGAMGTVWPLYLFSFVFVVVLQKIVYYCKVCNLEGAMGTVWPCICFPLYLLLYFRILCIFVRSGIWKEQWALRKSKFCGSRHKPTENERASVGVNEKEKRTSKRHFTLYTDTDHYKQMPIHYLKCILMSNSSLNFPFN